MDTKGYAVKAKKDLNKKYGDDASETNDFKTIDQTGQSGSSEAAKYMQQSPRERNPERFEDIDKWKRPLWKKILGIDN